MSSTPSPLIQASVGRGRLLGDGPHGPVLAVRSDRLGARPRARRRLVLSGTGVARLRQHVATSQLRSCPSLAVVHEAATDDTGVEGGAGIAVTYERTLAQGSSLARLLPETPPSWSQATGILAQVRDAVETLHHAGLAHGNVSATNVFVETRLGRPGCGPGSVRVLLTDAGVAIADGRVDATDAFEADEAALEYLADQLDAAAVAEPAAAAPAPPPPREHRSPPPPRPRHRLPPMPWLLAGAGTAGVVAGAAIGLVTS